MTSFARTILVAIAVLAGLEGATLLPVRVRWLLLIYVIVLGALAARSARSVRSPTWRTPIALAGLASLLPVGLAVLTSATSSEVIDLLVPTAIGWSVFFALLPLATDEHREPLLAESWRPRPVALIGFLAAAFGVLTLSHWLAAGDLAVVSDEALYLTQSRWMRFPEITWRVDEDLSRFFMFRKVGYLNGHLYGMYPPGWPALLAVFRYAGLEWWASIILGTVSILLTYAIGAKLRGPRVGAIAALLIATSPFYLMTHAGYMSHAATIAGLLGGTWCLLTGIDVTGWRRYSRFAAAGLLLGFVVTVRQLTGLTVGTSVGLWMVHRAWKVDRRLPFALAGWVVVGGVIPAVLFFAYNVAILGDALTTAYQVMHPGMYNLGFGVRGFWVLDANVNWVAKGFDFTPQLAVRQMAFRLAEMNTAFVPVGLLAPIVAAAVASGFRITWSRVALFTLLPLGFFFYWANILRQHTELLPFMLLAVAIILVAIHARWPRLATGLLVMVLASHAISSFPWSPAVTGSHMPWPGTDYAGIPGRKATWAIADSLAVAHKRVLLFSRDASDYDNQIDELYQHNGDRDEGPILVARDRGPLNEMLIRRYPDRVPFIVEDRGPNQAAVFVPLRTP